MAAACREISSENKNASPKAGVSAVSGRPCGARTCDQRIKRRSVEIGKLYLSMARSACQARQSISSKGGGWKLVNFMSQTRHMGHARLRLDRTR